MVSEASGSNGPCENYTLKGEGLYILTEGFEGMPTTGLRSESSMMTLSGSLYFLYVDFSRQTQTITDE